MATPRPPPRISLEELLLRHGAITQEQLAKAKEEQATIGGDLGRVLVDLGSISEDLLIRAWAHQLGIPRVAPDAMPVEQPLLQAIPVQVCERFGIIAVGRQGEGLVIATSDPANAEHLRAIGVAVGQDVVPVAATTDAIERGIRRHYYGEQPKPGDEEPSPDDPFGKPDAGAPPAPDYPALLARVEQLEQQTHAREAQILAILRAIGDILVEKGLVSREDYLKRVREQ